MGDLDIVGLHQFTSLKSKMLTARENFRAGEYYGKSGVLQPHFNQFLEDFLSILTIKLC